MITMYHKCLAMNTCFEVILHGSAEGQLKAVAEAAMNRIKELESHFSPYFPDSELNRVNKRAAVEPVIVSEEFLDVLEVCGKAWKVTKGAFDASIGGLVQAWIESRLSKCASDPEVLRAWVNSVGWGKVKIDRGKRTVHFESEKLQIDLSAIRKGYTLDQLVPIIRGAGIKSALLHGGARTIWCFGKSPAGTPWRVGVRPPMAKAPGEGNLTAQVLVYLPPRHMEDVDNPNWVRAHKLLAVMEVSDAALSVSLTGLEDELAANGSCGKIISPRTGRPVEGLRLCVVTADSAAMADAVSTGLMVMEPEEAQEVINTLPILEAYILKNRQGEWGSMPVLERLVPNQ